MQRAVNSAVWVVPDVIPRLNPRQTLSKQHNKVRKTRTRRPEENGQHFPLLKLPNSHILGCRESDKKSERFNCGLIRQKRKPDISRTKRTRKIAKLQPIKTAKPKTDSISPSKSNTVQYKKHFPKHPRGGEDPNTHARKMQDLDGATARKKWILPLKVALQKKNRNPPMNPGADETAGVH